jgi:hypothetical protein
VVEVDIALGTEVEDQVYNVNIIRHQGEATMSAITPVIATPNYQYLSPFLVNCLRISGRRADRQRIKIPIISWLTRSDDAVSLGLSLLGVVALACPLVQPQAKQT